MIVRKAVYIVFNSLRKDCWCSIERKTVGVIVRKVVFGEIDSNLILKTVGVV